MPRQVPLLRTRDQGLQLTVIAGALHRPFSDTGLQWHAISLRGQIRPDRERRRVDWDRTDEVVDNQQNHVALETGHDSVAEQLIKARAEPIVQGSL
jgi:hypothetical protein